MTEKKEDLVANIGQFVLGTKDNVLMCLGLGSCVGVAIFEKEKCLGGLMHVMLPKSPEEHSVDSNLFKYADVGLPLMIEELVLKGCDKNKLKAKIAGGAHMFKDTLSGDLMDIGVKNVEAVKKVLADQGIEILSQETGGNIGRTMKLDVGSCEVLIKTKEGFKHI